MPPRIREPSTDFLSFQQQEPGKSGTESGGEGDLICDLEIEGSLMFENIEDGLRIIADYPVRKNIDHV